MARNRIYLAKEGKAFREAVEEIVTDLGLPSFSPNEEIGIEARWFRERKSGDLDNRLKQLLDALQGLVYADDKQIVEIHAYRRDDKKNPRMAVRLWRAQ